MRRSRRTSCRRRSRRTASTSTRPASSSWPAASWRPCCPVHSFSKMQQAIAEQGVRRRGRRHPDPEVRGDDCRRSTGPGPRAAAHGVRRQGLRLHVGVHLVRDRQVVAQGLQGGRPHAHLLLDRPPDDSRRRQPQALRQVRRRPQQDHEGSLSADRARADAVGAALLDRRRRRCGCCSTSRPSASRTTPRRFPRPSSSTSRRSSIRSPRTRIRTRRRARRKPRSCGKGNEVHVYMTSIRSHFTPDNIEGIQLGDTVYFHLTNLEQDWDVPHGFAITGARNSELLVMPGQTRTLVWQPDRVGVFPFYCTDFCSALHQEMQGYVRVSPKGSAVKLTWNTPERRSSIDACAVTCGARHCRARQRRREERDEADDTARRASLWLRCPAAGARLRRRRSGTSASRRRSIPKVSGCTSGSTHHRGRSRTI